MRSEKDRAADEVIEAKTSFDVALSNKRKYPIHEFHVFARATRKYIAMTAREGGDHAAALVRTQCATHFPVTGLPRRSGWRCPNAGHISLTGVFVVVPSPMHRWPNAFHYGSLLQAVSS